MKFFIVALIATCCLCNAFGQTDAVGSGRAIRLDGVDDYVDLGNILDNLVFPFTISAWVNVDPTATSGPLFVSQDNASIYNGFWFYATPTTIWMEYGDGRGDGSPAFRRGKRVDNLPLGGRWSHVCSVVRGPNDIKLYVNGNDVGGYFTGESTLPMASNFPLDVAKIGFLFSNGSTYRYKGLTDEIRIYNRDLSVIEIRDVMCRKLTGSENGLIGYWTFDEISGNSVSDKTSNGLSGTLKNGVERLFSGAPLGDASVHRYQTNWTNVEFSMDENQDKITISDITGNPEGVHLYVVRDIPSQTSGLDVTNVMQPYFGAFIASTTTNKTLDAFYFFNNYEMQCKSTRQDNSGTVWGNTNLKIDNQLDRLEVIKDLGTDFDIDLGDDEIVCPMNSRTLKPIDDATGYSFTWQDGSTQSTFQANNYGEYWVDVKKGCTIASDTITFEKAAIDEYIIPNVFTPNEDDFNPTFILSDDLIGSSLFVYNRWGKLVYESLDYRNNWDGSGLPSGVYYYLVIGDCIEAKKGWVSIVK